MTAAEVLNYGGGRQTVALCVLIAHGRLPAPDRLVMADTGREKGATFAYLDAHVRPLLAGVGLSVEVAPHSLATVDLYGLNGDLLMPVYTSGGKLSAFCSTEWKARVVQRYLRGQGIMQHRSWIGFGFDERRRIKGTEGRWYPLVEHMLTTADCETIVERAGLPPAPRSACYMCPNMANAEWRAVRADGAEWERACQVDEELREEDRARGGTGVWVHASRRPLRDADLNADDRKDAPRPCGLGLCMV